MNFNIKKYTRQIIILYNQNPDQDEIRNRPRVVAQVIHVTMNENGVFLRRNQNKSR